MSIKVRAKYTKCNFRNGDFCIINLSPIGNYTGLTLSPYLTFSAKGELGYLVEGKEYDLEVEEISCDPRFGSCVRIISVPSMTDLDFTKLTEQESFEILMDCTSSEKIAHNILSAYPNFIEKILTEGQESIDLSLIHGVGKAYLNSYTRSLTERYKYYAMLQKFKDYAITTTDCKALISFYTNEDGISNALQENPYMVLITVLKRSFENADKTIMEVRPELKKSENRCAYLILSVLDQSENEGDTYTDANDLYHYILNEYPIAKDLEELIVPVVKTSELFYYEEETNRIAIATTYYGECMVAELVKEKTNNPHVLNIDYNKYKSVDGFELTDEQSKLLENVCKYDIAILSGIAGSGKAQPTDTIIPTPNGDKELGNIKVGDYVFDRFGKPTKVLGVFTQGMKDVYTVTLADGRKTQCNDEHLWSYYTSKGNLKTITLREMLNNGIYRKNNKRINSGIFKYKIPTNKAVEYKQQDLLINPYVLGSFIGNGCCKEKMLTLSSNDEEQVKKVARLINATPVKVCDKNYSWHFERQNKYISPLNGKTIKYLQTNEILDYLTGLKSNEKYIPNEYKKSSIEQRYELLQGLFDTDGYIGNNPPRYSLSYTTTSLRLAKDIQEILYSLGYNSSLSIDNRKNKNICYSVNVLVANDEKEKFFTLSRKKERAIQAKKYIKNKIYDRIAITDVKKENYQKEMVCIYVDNDEHLYLTNDYIVTHNTSSVKALIKLMEDNGLSYCLLAPTGAAALRLSEQTNRKASTIHRKCLKDQEINSDIIIIDEMSMVGLDVFIMMLNCVTNPNAKIIMCGDMYQLPSISKGCVFSDMITSGKVPIAELTKVFRYDTSGGAFVGENVRNGRNFFESDRVKVKDNVLTISGNYKFIETDDIFDNVIDEYNRLTKKYKPDEIIILSPYNVGDCGTYRLNECIENEYNAPKPNELSLSYKRDGVNIVFRKGSRVVNTKNDYKAMPLESWEEILNSNGVLTEEDVQLTQLFNGQIGVVREVQEKYLVCQFSEELIVIQKPKLNTLLLARAISTHRSQGGEWKAVINIVSEMHSRLLSKQLLYVADTRMKEFHCDIGNQKAFTEALLVDVVDARNTFLKELILKESIND